MVIQTGDNKFGVAKWIVDATASLGTHTTIASALTSASSGDTIFIRPGSYTENITLKAGVNLTAFTDDGLTPNVTIVGNATMSTAGTVSISGIRLQTNSAACLTVSGSAASIVNINDCYINCSNATGISFTSSSSSAQITITNCRGNLGTTGISLFSHSSAGSLQFFHSVFYNTGGSSTASTCSAGVCNAINSQFLFPITYSGTAASTWEHCLIDTSAQNVTCATLGGSVIQSFKWTRFVSGTASAISISTTAQIELCTVSSSNANAITGAGTLEGNTISFNGTSSTINVTTRTQFPFGITGTWTPNLQINGSSVGITYTTQTGGYTHIGNVVHFWMNILLSSKGASVGAVTISNFPVATSSNGVNQACTVAQFNQVTAAGYTTLSIQFANNSTVGSFAISGPGAAAALLLNTNISNTFLVKFTGSYIVN